MTDSLASDHSLSSIGHYELRKRLGEGGYGQVYEAWDQLLHRSVALKCLTNASGQAGSERLMREARLAASLHHPAFVKIFGFENDGRAEFIVMELVRGSTLRGQAADCTADPPRALDIIDQVAAAMAEAHAAGLVHGDLKPGNLMLQPGGAGLHGLALASAHMHTSSHQWQYPRHLDPGLLQLILAMPARDPAARLPSMVHLTRQQLGRQTQQQRQPRPTPTPSPTGLLSKNKAPAVVAATRKRKVQQTTLSDYQAPRDNNPYSGSASSRRIPTSCSSKNHEARTCLKAYKKN